VVQNTGGNNFVLFVHHLVVELFVVFRHPVLKPCLASANNSRMALMVSVR
jgi:hypothetical protein